MQIQAEILEEGISVPVILRKAKVLATQLDSDELGAWVSGELDGYDDAEKLPDYRVLSTAAAGRWTNGYWTVKNRAVPMFEIDDEELKKALTTFPVLQGIRTVESLAADLGERKFMISPDVTALVNHHVKEGGYGYTSLHYSVSPHHFEQILDTVRNRLLDFVLELDKHWNVEEDPPPTEEVRQLVQVFIFNHPEGGPVTIFDQRGQNVQYQFNAAGNINIGAARSIEELSEQLGKLRDEIDVARAANVIPEDTAIEASYHVLQADKEIESADPDKPSILDHMGKAKALLEDLAAAAGLVAAITEAVEVVGRLL